MLTKSLFIALLMGLLAVAPPARAEDEDDSSGSSQRSSDRDQDDENDDDDADDDDDEDRDGDRDDDEDRDSDRSAKRSDRESESREHARHEMREQVELREETQRFIERYDANRDGHLAQTELPGHMQDNFTELDRNRNRYISPIELRIHARRMQRLSAMPVEVTYIWITGVDRGRLDLRELQQAYKLLRKIDKNEDGQIAQSELRETRREVATQWVDCIFEHCDDNEDDQIDRNESRDTAISYAFSRFDRNQDERLSRNELRRVALSDQPESETERSARRTERDSDDYSEER